MRFPDEKVDGESLLDLRERIPVDFGETGRSDNECSQSGGENEAGRFHELGVRIEYIGIINVGNAHHQDTHFPHCTVDYTGRDMNHGAGVNRVFLTIENHGTFPLKHVVEFGGTLVVVRPGTINVHGVSPRSNILVTLTDKSIAVSAGAAFPRGVMLVAKNELPWRRGSRSVCHPADCM